MSVVFNDPNCFANLSGTTSGPVSCGVNGTGTAGIQLGRDPFEQYTGQSEGLIIYSSALNTTQTERCTRCWRPIGKPSVDSAVGASSGC